MIRDNYRIGLKFTCKIGRLVQSGALPLPDGIQASTPKSINPTHKEITSTSLEAHQTLMAVNPENVNRFKDVTKFLAEDLKTLEKGV